MSFLRGTLQDFFLVFFRQFIFWFLKELDEFQEDLLRSPKKKHFYGMSFSHISLFNWIFTKKFNKNLLHVKKDDNWICQKDLHHMFVSESHEKIKMWRNARKSVYYNSLTNPLGGLSYHSLRERLNEIPDENFWKKAWLLIPLKIFVLICLSKKKIWINVCKHFGQTLMS